MSESSIDAAAPGPIADMRYVAGGMQNTTNACWKTLAFYGFNYTQKPGVQLASINSMSAQPGSNSR
jgi:hypothetical protein